MVGDGALDVPFWKVCDNMSLSEKHNVKCIKCGNNFEINEWNSINVEEMPEIREKVMNGDIFKFTCNHCNETHNIIYNCLYYDKTNKSYSLPFCVWLIIY